MAALAKRTLVLWLAVRLAAVQGVVLVQLPRPTCDDEQDWRLSSNEELQTLQNYSAVQCVVISGEWVTSLDGLQGLETATAIIIDGTNITSLAGLENLSEVGWFGILDNQNLVSLTGLQSLQSAGTFEVQGENNELRSLTGLEQLTRVEGDLRVRSTTGLRSLVGLESLQSVRQVIVEDNKGLESLVGLGSLTAAERVYISSNTRLLVLDFASLQSVEYVDVYGNIMLKSLVGFDNLTEVVGDMDIQLNALESLHGLESLTSVGGRLYLSSNFNLLSLRGLESLTGLERLELEQNHNLLSTSGLDRLQEVRQWLMIHDCDALETLRLESLTHVGQLLIWRNPNLASLSGLQSLRTAGQLRISDMDALESLYGLGNLEHVWGDLVIDGNDELVSFEGLERLQSVRELRIDTVNKKLRWLFPGLQSLSHALSWISIKHCRLSSLLGLGALQVAGGLRVQVADVDSCGDALAAPMQVLGGPLAAGASIGAIAIDEGTWPLCMTPHERFVLASAVTGGGSPMPKQRCDGRDLIELATCTRGQPCSFSVANFSIDGEEKSTEGSVFISGLDTGCGDCPENHLQSRITTDRMVEFGSDALRGEAVGLRSLCLCGDSGQRGPVGELLLRGPRLSHPNTTCIRGHNCTVTLDGKALNPADEVVLVRGACDEGGHSSGFVAKWISGNESRTEYLLDSPTGWHVAPAAVYQVCWRAACAEDDTVCPGGSHVDISNVELRGLAPYDYVVTFGEDLIVENIGIGALEGDADWMHLLHSCGSPNNDGMRTLEANSSGNRFYFGRVTTDLVQAGTYHLCWCQEFGGQNGVKCKDESDFVAESGKVEVLCPAGQERDVGSGRCRRCPAGRQRLGPLNPRPEPCAECQAGHFSQGGEGECKPCPPRTFAAATGSSGCVACRGWESAKEPATRCAPSLPRLGLLASFSLSAGALCALLVHSVKRRLPLLDVALDEGRTIVTTLGPHGLSNFGSASFTVAFHKTGHPGLDSPSKPLRATVIDTSRLELLTHRGSSIKSRLDTSMGTLQMAFRQEVFHQGYPFPLVVSVPGILIVVVALGALIMTAGLAAEAAVAATVTAVACTAASVARRVRSRATPLELSLLEFEHKLAEQNRTRRCEKGPLRALAVGWLHQLLEVFPDFIRDRTAFYLVSNILVPLTRAQNVSYAELVGPQEVEWFVSHFWGTAYAHFFVALQKHAETVCGAGNWTDVLYWVCFCSSNQHKIEDELSAGMRESSFYLALKSAHCKGTCMVLDDEALPLTRIWCIFELLQTVNLKHTSDSFMGLLFCTSGGVLNTGSGSVEVAMALSKKLADMDLATAQATREIDAKRIRDEVVQMGSLATLNRFICREVHDMLATAQGKANERFAAVLMQLKVTLGL